MSEQKIALEMIRRDGGTQSRSYLSSSTIEDYAAAMKRGEEFPAVKLIYTGDAYYLVDGFHRVAAAEKAGLPNINAEVEQGTLEDAQWASYAANPTHGLPRSSDDKRRAIIAALKHPKGVEKSDREIATHIRVDHKTVGSVRKQLIERGEIPHLEERVGADGKTYKVPVVQESLDGWPEKHVKPWVESFEGSELVLVKWKDDLYLCLSFKWAKLLREEHGLSYEYTSLRNASGYEHTIKLSQSFVDALLSAGHVIRFVEPSALPPIVKRLAEAAMASRQSPVTFTPLSFEVKQGDLVMNENGVAYQVTEVRPTILVVTSPGEETPRFLSFSEAKPYALNWSMDKENELQWQHTNGTTGVWHKKYARLKNLYAHNAVLIYRVGKMVIALGEDAERFKSTETGLYAQTKLGPAYVIMLGKKKVELNFDVPVVSFSSYHDEDAVSWANGLISDAMRTPAQAAPATAAPAHSPTGESSELQRDVLSLLYELQELRGGWIGNTLININGTEAGLLSAGRIVRLQRRGPSGGVMLWYQITPAGCSDIGREPLPVVPEPKDEYPPADANAERYALAVRLNERLIEVRDLLREMDSVDPDLHGQLYPSYEVMRTQVLSAMGVELEPELLV